MMRGDGAKGVVIIALGSNLPWREREPRAILSEAVINLGAFGVVEARSGWWRTRAWPDPDDPPFCNLCVRLLPEVEPDALMAGLLDLEARFGRARGEANAPRTLDLDVIDFAGRVIDAPATDGRPALRLPHPRLRERAFVLLPLRDVAPAWRHPSTGESVDELIARLTPEQRAGATRMAPGSASRPVILGPSEAESRG